MARESIPPDPPQDVEQAIAQLAQQIAEEPRRIRKRQDVTQILASMSEGVIAALHVSRPRFTATVAPKRRGTALGLEKLGISGSAAGQQVIKDYFTLGRHSLLPTELQKELATIENAARACLDRYAFRTHWGYFIPASNYAVWKEENSKHEEKFWEKKAYVLEHYDEIIEEVIAAYQTLAEDAWMQTSFGAAVVREQKEHLSSELFEELYQHLKTGQGKTAFIETYLSSIRQAIPPLEEVAAAFEYDVELGYIPLPSLLARDVLEADLVIRARALRDAQVRAEMDTIEAQRRAELEAIEDRQRLEEAQRRAEWQQLNQQERQEQQLTYLKLQAEREKLQQQQAMDRDVLATAKRQKEQLVQEFYTGIVAQINELVREVCDKTLESLDENGGILRGPVSTRLRDLVVRLERLNFIEDAQIGTQIERLRAVLPTQAQQEEAGKGIARIDTSGIRRVVQQLHKEAEATLLELDLGPLQRAPRQVDVTPDNTALIADEPRKRRSLDLGAADGSGAKRRARKTV
ncbi:MAG: hypothetical protein ACRDIV_17730 [Ktedonobacteraceae bacterium]